MGMYMSNQQMLDNYIRLGKKLKRLPSTAELLSIGISRAMVRHHFGNMTTLKKIANQRLKFKSKPKSITELLKGVLDEAI
jgi:hypothetical protein